MKTISCSFTYGRQDIPYEVRFVDKRKTLGIEVHPDSRVLIRAPCNVDLNTINERVLRRARWISKQLDYFRQYSPRTPQRHYVNGETHLYLGRQYRLKVTAGKARDIQVSRGTIHVTCREKVNPGQVEQTLHSWYLAKAKQIFNEVLETHFQPFAHRRLKRPSIIVRAMKTRWGSLSSNGSITLNSSLIKTPRACIEYVVVHELCHLLHRDHSPLFYRALGRAMPDWQKRKRKLELALL